MQKITKKDLQDLFLAASALIKNALAVSSEYVIDLHHVPAGCKLSTPTLCVTQVGNRPQK